MNTEISNTSSAEVFVETIEFTPFELAAHIKATEAKLEPMTTLNQSSRLQQKATELGSMIRTGEVEPDSVFANLARREVTGDLNHTDLLKFYMQMANIPANLGAKYFFDGMMQAHFRLEKEQLT